MEKGIYIFKEGTKDKLLQEVDRFLSEVKKKFGVSIWLVEIMGRRVSYLAGEKEDSFLPPEMKKLWSNLALVSNNWDKLSREKVEEVIENVRRILE